MTDNLLGIARQAFLDNAWRSAPHLFRKAIDPAGYPLSRSDIATLVSNDLVESRLVSEDYRVTWGPFEDTGAGDFIPAGQLLMVHCLEQFLPQVVQLLDDHFGFLPRWQIDDVMATIGADGSSCGAHFDRYDVFLVQLSGRKRWLLDTGPHSDSELREDREIRLLDSFQATTEYLLEPGDVLYIPPGSGHHGICEGDSITVSVGIRNPNEQELLSEVLDSILEQLNEPVPIERSLHKAAGIPSDSIDSIRQILSDRLTDETIVRWYGCYVTRLREPDVLQDFVSQLPEPGPVLAFTRPTRAAFHGSDAQLLLFVNGECFSLPPVHQPWIAALVTDRSTRAPASLDPPTLACLQSLAASGALSSGQSAP